MPSSRRRARRWSRVDWPPRANCSVGGTRPMAAGQQTAALGRQAESQSLVMADRNHLPDAGRAVAAPAQEPARLPPVCPNPVFVIGSPRSGTTALARALAKHSDLWASGETHVLFHLFRGGYAEGAFDRAIDSPGPRWLRVEDVSREEFLAHLGMGVNALFTSRSEGRRWIDHTPLNTLIADTLAAVFPGASFVHILRDGREVINSMLNFLDSRLDPAVARFVEQESGWATDMRRACAEWREHVDAATGFCDEHTDRATVVRYEELVAAPAETFGRIHRFLGIANEERPARFFSSRRINSSFGERPRLSASQLWETWDDEWRGTFAEVAGATMLACGYWTPSEAGDLADATGPGG
ncbi:MAG: hypothetical protein GEU88_02830 [Solirubrobacterales bacterium]|nr:hypothetical protein [Solirubrobacterales bacterium]